MTAVSRIVASAPSRRGLPAAGAVWLLVFAACNSGGSDSERPASSVPDSVAAASDEAPDGGEVRVVEQGLSVFPGPAQPGTGYTPEAVAAGQDHDVVSWGVVVENTSDWVATYTDIAVDLVDPGGAVTLRDRPGAETVVVLLPGERYGTGHTGMLTEGGEPADLEVEIGPSEWVTADARGVEFAEITARGIETSNDERLRFVTAFAMESSYSTSRPVWATAVFRNADGEIIGGTSRANDTYGYDPDRTAAPGRSSGEITISRTVPTVDDTQSEVYLDPVSPEPGDTRLG